MHGRMEFTAIRDFIHRPGFQIPGVREAQKADESLRAR